MGEVAQELAAKEVEEVIEAFVEELQDVGLIFGVEDEAADQFSASAKGVGDLAVEAVEEKVEAIFKGGQEALALVGALVVGIGDEGGEGLDLGFEVLVGVYFVVAQLVDGVEEVVEVASDLGDFDFPGALGKLAV